MQELKFTPLMGDVGTIEQMEVSVCDTLLAMSIKIYVCRPVRRVYTDGRVRGAHRSVQEKSYSYSGHRGTDKEVAITTCLLILLNQVNGPDFRQYQCGCKF